MSSGAGQRLAGFRVEYTLLTLPPGTTVGATSCLDTPEDCCVGSSGSSGSGSLGCAVFSDDWPDTLDLVVSGATNPDCNGTFTLTWDGWRYLLERSLVDPPDCVDLAQDPGPYTLTYLLEEWDGGIRFRMTLEGAVQVYGEAVADDLAGTCCPAIDLVGSVDYPCCGLGTLDIGISGACAGGSSGSSGSGGVSTPCLEQVIPETLYLTLTKVGEGCACAPAGGVVELTYTGPPVGEGWHEWTGSFSFPCGTTDTLTFIFACNPGITDPCESFPWVLSITGSPFDCGPPSFTFDPLQCSDAPFQRGGTFEPVIPCGDCDVATTYNWTMTETP